MVKATTWGTYYWQGRLDMSENRDGTATIFLMNDDGSVYRRAAVTDDGSVIQTEDSTRYFLLHSNDREGGMVRGLSWRWMGKCCGEYCGDSGSRGALSKGLGMVVWCEM